MFATRRRTAAVLLAACAIGVGILTYRVSAAERKGEAKPASCLFYLPMPPGARFFDGQVLAIEKLLEQRQAPYPVERTLLTTGVLAAALDSHHEKDQRLETPWLELRYRAPADSGFIRGPVAAG